MQTGGHVRNNTAHPHVHKKTNLEHKSMNAHEVIATSLGAKIKSPCTWVIGLQGHVLGPSCGVGGPGR